MLKYLLVILSYIVALAIIFVTLIIGSLIMILKAIVWDFKFSFKIGKRHKLSLLEMWGNTTHIPGEIWDEIKSGFKIGNNE